MLSFVPSCPCRVRARRHDPACSPSDLAFGTAPSVPTPKARRVLFDSAVGAVASLLLQPFSHPSFSLVRASIKGAGSSYLGKRRSLLWVVLGWERAFIQLLVHLSHLQLGRLPSASREGGEASSWPLLSFLTQGELSVPCCLLTICNRCKYLLLINSLKEMQRRVCGEALCWRGPRAVWYRDRCAGCSSPALATKAKALRSGTSCVPG